MVGGLQTTLTNSAGGYAYPVDDWTRLDRFLVLGSQSDSYYASEAVLTRDNAQAVLRAIAADGERAVARIVAISEGGRAPKNDLASFALALAAAAEDLGARRAALAALPRVARTGTHLFQFAAFAEGVRGWGRALRRAVGAWYTTQPAERLADQLVKYRQREGWSHRDLLRLSHPEVTDRTRSGDQWGGSRGADPRARPAARSRPDGAAGRAILAYPRQSAEWLGHFCKRPSREDERVCRRD